MLKISQLSWFDTIFHFIFPLFLFHCSQDEMYKSLSHFFLDFIIMMMIIIIIIIKNDNYKDGDDNDCNLTVT